MGMILRKSNENEIEKIVEISKKSFDTDILVGGKENDGSPQYKGASQSLCKPSN